MADVGVMQRRLGDVYAAPASPGTAPVHVPQHVDRAAELAVAAHAPAGPHPTVPGTLHQNHVARTAAVHGEVLRLAVVCTRHNTTHSAFSKETAHRKLCPRTKGSSSIGARRRLGQDATKRSVKQCMILQRGRGGSDTPS